MITSFRTVSVFYERVKTVVTLAGKMVKVFGEEIVKAAEDREQ
jgi:hypothetical protein